MGYRQIVGNTAVLGAYVLGDYTQTTTNHDIWMISPGIEALGRVWDFRANGYFPTGDKDWKIEGWADDFGNYSHITFSGHNQFDAWYTYHEETGPGADAEVGRKLFNCHNVLVKGFANGYYFYMDHNDDVYGGGARVTIQPNTYLEFSLNDTYDNYAHNTFMFGIQISIYDLFQPGSKVLDNKDLQRRLFDPIDRNFAGLGSGSNARITGGPTGDQQPEIGYNYLEKENIWFFNGAGLSASANNGITARGTTARVAPTTTLDDGTFEHPFTAADFNQQTLQDIYDLTKNRYSNAYLYFNGGTYNAVDAFASGAPYTPIELFPGESMWGRMGAQKGYQEPATGNNRPLFLGALTLPGNNGLDSIRLQNVNGENSYGILVQNNNVTFNNIQVGTSALNTNINYKHGIQIGDGNTVDNVTLNDSTIYAYYVYTNFYNSPVMGILINNNSRIILDSNNTIVATAKGVNRYTTAGGIGQIFFTTPAGEGFFGNARVNVEGNNNHISATAEATGSDRSAAVGILAETNISGNNNTITTFVSATNNQALSLGIQGFDRSVTISGDNNTINANAQSGSGDGIAVGIIGIGNEIININGTGTTINAGWIDPATGKCPDKAVGIYYDGDKATTTTNLLINNTTFNIASTGARWGIASRDGYNDPSDIIRLRNNNNFDPTFPASYRVGKYKIIL